MCSGSRQDHSAGAAQIECTASVCCSKMPFKILLTASGVKFNHLLQFKNTREQMHPSRKTTELNVIMLRTYLAQSCYISDPANNKTQCFSKCVSLCGLTFLHIWVKLLVITYNYYLDYGCTHTMLAVVLIYWKMVLQPEA